MRTYRVANPASVEAPRVRGVMFTLSVVSWIHVDSVYWLLLLGFLSSLQCPENGRSYSGKDDLND